MSCLMILIKPLTIMLGLYVLVESVLAFSRMPGGWVHFCSKVKYVFAFSSSVVFIYCAWNYGGMLLWVAFGSAGTLALFIWPRMIWRLRQYVDEFKCLEL